MAVRTRNIVNGNVVWFGSSGKNSDGTAIKTNNYATEQQSVVAGLIQRLSVLKGELWYKVSFGQPLTDKVKSKVAYDSFVTSTIMSHPDVKEILSFSSSISNKTYSCKTEILTIYGKISLEV